MGSAASRLRAAGLIRGRVASRAAAPPRRRSAGRHSSSRSSGDAAGGTVRVSAAGLSRYQRRTTSSRSSSSWGTARCARRRRPDAAASGPDARPRQPAQDAPHLGRRRARCQRDGLDQPSLPHDIQPDRAVEPVARGREQGGEIQLGRLDQRPVRPPERGQVAQRLPHLLGLLEAALLGESRHHLPRPGDRVVVLGQPVAGDPSQERQHQLVVVAPTVGVASAGREATLGLPVQTPVPFGTPWHRRIG